jgi:hypothetical protein
MPRLRLRSRGSNSPRPTPPLYPLATRGSSAGIGFRVAAPAGRPDRQRRSKQRHEHPRTSPAPRAMLHRQVVGQDTNRQQAARAVEIEHRTSRRRCHDGPPRATTAGASRTKSGPTTHCRRRPRSATRRRSGHNRGASTLSPAFTAELVARSESLRPDVDPVRVPRGARVAAPRARRARGRPRRTASRGTGSPNCARPR